MKKFESEALKANLAATRSKKIVIPPDHEWFISLSENHFGIHKRAEEFMLEYHHPFTNQEQVVDLLRKIALDDMWHYLSQPDHERALLILVDIFNNLLRLPLPDQQQERAMQTLLEFAESLYPHKNVKKGILQRVVSVIQETLPVSDYVHVRFSGVMKGRGQHLANDPEVGKIILDLMRHSLTESLDFWEKSSNIEAWLENKRDIFHSDMTGLISAIGAPFFAAARKQLAKAKTMEELQKVVDFSAITNLFRGYIDELDSVLDRIYYLFYLINLPGMSHLQEHLLWDLNRMLRIVCSECNEREMLGFIEKIFILFEAQKSSHMNTLLDCILTLGREVIAQGEPVIINYFTDKLISFGFVPGSVHGVNREWQVSVDKNHVKNIRVWMELVECAPLKMFKLLAALIVNLRIGGIFISDTDLFQRDITRLLNSDIAPIYKMVKLLARIFPVYFNEIGAEGELRQITTTMDEVSFRRDRLIHFLRKQVHTESNNTHIELTRKICRYWYDGNKKALKDIIPGDVYHSLKESGEWFDPVHSIVTRLCEQYKVEPEALPDQEDLDLEGNLKGYEERDRTRIRNLIALNRLLEAKYTLDHRNIVSLLKQQNIFPDEEVEELERKIHENDPEVALRIVYRFLERLKNIILNPEASEGWENIYYKRHIAVGIPSMYGKYHEAKFEALGLTFRLENLASILMERMISQINMSYITAKSLRKIVDILDLFFQGLKLDGVYNQGFASHLKMFQYSLTSASFSMNQFVNLFLFIAQDIRSIINEYFLRNFDNPLKTAIIQQKRNLRVVSDPATGDQQLIHKCSEKFYREVLSSAFLLQHLDNFISTILLTLHTMVGNLTPEVLHNVMEYDPDLIISPMHQKTPEMDNQIFLGAKGYFLKKLYAHNFPIPPGFILTTEVFRHRKAIIQHSELQKEVHERFRQEIARIEELTGKRLGDPANPLLLSIRAGTTLSMPGAMNTFLNVGMNDMVAEGMCRRPKMGWTTWDCYRRLLQGVGMANGITRDEFDRIINRFKERHQVAHKIQFKVTDMREITLSYKKLLAEHGVQLEQEPFQQVIQAIRLALDSWDSDRAMTYRKHLQIADEWGTAVIVQKMVMGNRNNESGTGVLFTHDPHEDKPGVHLFGDFTLFSQGEDVVSGLVHTLPISEKQRKGMTGNMRISLEKDFPEIFRELLKRSRQMIEEYGFVHQEIEFTFESPRKEDLYILQTRDHTPEQREKICVFEVDKKAMKFLGSGIGIGGCALNGILVFNMEDLLEYAARFPDRKRILVKPDTVPDDIEMIFECDGLLTARGGATSHAAVTAGRLGKICVVNCKVLQVMEAEKRCFIGGEEFHSGDEIAIDGRLGNIYRGNYPVGYAEGD
ncbi:MAG TPA: PEP/pyruvate-binding domain-containing protein [Geobacteraceae bacterium]|nr:PEP/pyruvate-binding domain-containing protein [Geobacteraceae bacterium]